MSLILVATGVCAPDVSGWTQRTHWWGSRDASVRVDWPEGGERVRDQVGTRWAILPRPASFTEFAQGSEPDAPPRIRRVDGAPTRAVTGDPVGRYGPLDV